MVWTISHPSVLAATPVTSGTSQGVGGSGGVFVAFSFVVAGGAVVAEASAVSVGPAVRSGTDVGWKRGGSSDGTEDGALFLGFGWFLV